MSLTRYGFPLVLAAPSGAGKTSVARALVSRNPDMVFSISATTRPPRRAEQDGRDYDFVSGDAFDRMAAAGELLEWAVVHGHRYGTPRAAVEAALEEGTTVVLDIDVQGARQIRRAYADAVLVFILPPTAAELVRRLTGRRSEADAEVRRRLENARGELGVAAEFDYVVVNETLSATVEAVEGLARAERLRVGRTRNLDAVVTRLESEIATWLKGSR